MGKGLADRALCDLVEGHPLRLRGRHMGGLGDVPGDGLTLAVEVGREEDRVGQLGRLGDLGDLLAAVVRDDIFGGEVVVDVHPELALAGVFWKVTDVTIGGEDAVVRAQIAFDRPRLGRRFHDHKVLWHGRECSTGSCTPSSLGLVSGSRQTGAPGGGARCEAASAPTGAGGHIEWPTLLMIVETWPPRKIRATIAMIAMRARIKAYSASPWPSSRVRRASPSLS